MSDNDQTYKVVFSGNTIEGNSTSDVAKRFAEAFKLNDQASIQQLFSGKIITLKRGLNYEQAQRYSRILQKLGADCCIECENVALFGAFDSEPDYDYERKKRRRVAQFSQGGFANVGLTPK
ncbi:MAG: hypothetical protein ACRBCI_02460 [Cellvibrionaceae bacterium]